LRKLKVLVNVEFYLDFVSSPKIYFVEKLLDWNSAKVGGLFHHPELFLQCAIRFFQDPRDASTHSWMASLINPLA